VCSVDFDDYGYEAGLLAGYVRHAGRLEKALLLLVQGPEADAVDLEVRVMVDAVNCHDVVLYFFLIETSL
jgi:hypothetical protein